MSAATIDRVLLRRGCVAHTGRRHVAVRDLGRRSGAALPVRTFADWDDPPPGFMEADLVAHCGGVKAKGSYVQTLTYDRHRDRLDGMRGLAGARADAG